MTEEVLTVEEAAQLLRLHVNTIRTRAESGDLPGWKIGGQWRFLRSALMENFQGANAGNAARKI